MIDELQNMTKKMDLEYDNYMEVEMREQYLFDEKIRLYR